jgi:hypothetical protein
MGAMPRLHAVRLGAVPAELAAAWVHGLGAQSNSGGYLGDFGSSMDPNSIYNQYGTYGSPYSPNSVNNPYGTYGSPYSPYSATNLYAMQPPRVVVPGVGSYPFSVNPFARQSKAAFTAARAEMACRA